MSLPTNGRCKSESEIVDTSLEDRLECFLDFMINWLFEFSKAKQRFRSRILDLVLDQDIIEEVMKAVILSH